MKKNHYSVQLRTLKHKVDRLRKLLMSGTAPKRLIHTLMGEIRRLATALYPVISKRQLKRMLGSFVFLLGSAAGFNAYGQSFLPPVTNPFGLVMTADIVFAEFADIDGDGDLDLLTAGYYAEFMYYENTGTANSPQFAAGVANPFGLTPALGYIAAPTIADMDNDGDLDLLVGEYYGNLRYYENTGNATSPSFPGSVLNPFGLTPAYYYGFPDLADLDGDGDFDLLAGEYDGNLQYYQNIGTAATPQFGASVQNTYGMSPGLAYSFPELADFDSDGDLDLLVGEYYGNFKYFENTGSSTSPLFAAPLSNPFGIGQAQYLGMPAAADLDGDGDMDLLVAEYMNFVYYENQMIMGLDEAEINLTVYPNPFTDKLSIESDLTMEDIRILELSGREVMVVSSPGKVIDLSSLDNGAYLMEINFGGDKRIIRKINRSGN